MSEKDIDSKIGDAWKAHYQGNQTAAIEQFKQLVDQAPESVDAHWGLGLAYRKAGDLEKARDVFIRAKELLEAQLDALDTDEIVSRLPMLNRMVDQQLEYIGEFNQ